MRLIVVEFCDNILYQNNSTLSLNNFAVMIQNQDI